jgi:hypothetical protein
MLSLYTYEAHQHIEARSERNRERDLGHIRALTAVARTDGIVHRVARQLDRVRPGALPQTVLTYDLHELKGAVCRLADGAMGRVTVRESDGVWVAICVPA